MAMEWRFLNNYEKLSIVDHHYPKLRFSTSTFYKRQIYFVSLK